VDGGLAPAVAAAPYVELGLGIVGGPAPVRIPRVYRRLGRRGPGVDGGTAVAQPRPWVASGQWEGPEGAELADAGKTRRKKHGEDEEEGRRRRVMMKKKCGVA
jgi:hypothetical protein